MALDKDWCLEPFDCTTPNKFEYNNIGEQYAVDQILLAGHYLYSVNTEFRDMFKEVFNEEMTIPGKDEVDFLYKNKFNILYFGLLACPLLISEGPTPKAYRERCSPENNMELSQWLADETHRTHRPVQSTPGCPFYYEKISKTKFFKNSLTGEINFICSGKMMLTRAIEYAKLLQEDAQIVLNNLMKNENLKTSLMMNVIRDESWSPFLYAAKQK